VDLRVALLLIACGGNRPPAARPPAAVKIAAVQQKVIPETTEYLATVRSRRAVELRPEVEGRVDKILVRSGDVVRVGAPLFQIDPARQRAAVRSQSAARRARRATLGYAEKSFRRTRELYAREFVSRDELDRARAELEAARASYGAQAATTEEERVELGYHVVRAPVGGAVGDVPVRVGDRVTSSSILTSVVSNEPLELYVGVPLERAGALRIGQPLEVLSPEGKLVARRSVEFIAPRADDATQTVLVKTRLDGDEVPLRSAQFVRVRVEWSLHEGPVLAATAVTRLNEQAFAFVPEDKEGSLIARRRPIRVGPLVGSDYVVLEGLKPGERVIVSGVQTLADGVPVRPIE
jgi:RND family efflux transporter MFP subunit